MNESYLNTSLDLGLEQLVNFPTRFNPDNKLDLLFTNRPSLVQKCSAIPGLSDHAAVLISTRLRPAKSKPAKRKILLWKRADMASVRARIDELTQEFHEAHTTETPIQDIWDAFSLSMKRLMKDHIPSKWTSSTLHQTVGEHHDKEAIQAAKEGLEEASPTKTPQGSSPPQEITKGTT